MSDSKLSNIPASVRQKLLNLARERNENFQLLLTKYGLERVLFRLSTSKHRDIFILKGALLFELWTHERYRPTRDADFLATGDNSPERFAAGCRERAVPPSLRHMVGAATNRIIGAAILAKGNSNHHGDRIAYLQGTHFDEERPSGFAKCICLDTGFEDSDRCCRSSPEFAGCRGVPRPDGTRG
jgi:hypothetical protein